MTAKDLLQKLLDYHYQWGLLAKIDSRPAKIRKQQIDSLQRAFGLISKGANPGDQALPESIDYLLTGKFLLERPREKNGEIADRMATTLRLAYPQTSFERTNESDITWLFNDLMNFRTEVYKIAYIGGVDESSPGLLYSQYLQRNLQEVIRKNLDEIDETLWIILDPEKRVLDKKVLVDNYGYPDEDLDEIDLEWLMNDNLLKNQKEVFNRS